MKYTTFKALGFLTTAFSSTAVFANTNCDVEKFEKLLNKGGAYNSEAKTYFDATSSKMGSMYAKKMHLEFLAKKLSAAGCVLSSYSYSDSDSNSRWALILKSVYMASGFKVAVFEGSDAYRSYVVSVPQAYDAVNASVVLGTALKKSVNECGNKPFNWDWNRTEECLLQALSPSDYNEIKKQRDIEFDQNLDNAVSTAYRMLKAKKTNSEVVTALAGLKDNSKIYTALFWGLLLQNDNNFFENKTINMLSIFGSDSATWFEWIVK